jgi:hypothetical protein
MQYILKLLFNINSHSYWLVSSCMYMVISNSAYAIRNISINPTKKVQFSPLDLQNSLIMDRARNLPTSVYLIYMIILRQGSVMDTSNNLCLGIPAPDNP